MGKLICGRGRGCVISLKFQGVGPKKNLYGGKRSAKAGTLRRVESSNQGLDIEQNLKKAQRNSGKESRGLSMHNHGKS